MLLAYCCMHKGHDPVWQYRASHTMLCILGHGVCARYFCRLWKLFIVATRCNLCYIVLLLLLPHNMP